MWAREADWKDWLLQRVINASPHGWFKIGPQIRFEGPMAPLEWQGKRIKPVRLNCRRDMSNGRFA